MTEKYTHLERAVPNNGEVLTVGDIPLSKVLARAARTPIYAYDRQLIEERIALLRDALPEKIALHYAVKANPMAPLLSFLLKLVDGFDVASKGELQTVLNVGANPATVSFAGPGKTDEELRVAIASEICISVESSMELLRCARIAQETHSFARICLRINPLFELRSSGMKMTGHPSQFGLDVTEVEKLLGAAPLDGLRYEGVQVYSGSQNLNTEALIEAAEKTLELVAQMSKLLPSPLAFANIGGGFGIPYFAHETPFELGAVGQALKRKLAAMSKVLEQTQIVMELGRYIVGEAGYYLTKVIDIKISQGQKFVVVDGGMHHHLANSGNFGQTLRKNYPLLVANKITQIPSENVNVVGPLCTPLDIVAKDVKLPPIDIGDTIAVLQSGAYGYSASPLKFLGHEEPVELLI